ncbi:hypothetical protein IGI04_029193, partial [Brassica rapa subsp. trilocularis]
IRWQAPLCSSYIGYRFWFDSAVCETVVRENPVVKATNVKRGGDLMEMKGQRITFSGQILNYENTVAQVVELLGDENTAADLRSIYLNEHNMNMCHKVIYLGFHVGYKVYILAMFERIGTFGKANSRFRTNKKVKSFWLGLNEFADLSHEEFKNEYLGLKTDIERGDDERSYQEFAYKDVDVEALPKSEVINKIVTENLWKNGGVRKEEDYPYSMEDESEMVTISGQQDVPRNDEKSLLKALAHHLSVSLLILLGVFDGRCSVNLDHGIAAVVTKRNTYKLETLCGINKMASFLH